MISLLNGDCLEVMKSIKANSIDFILCDPPYGTTPCEWDNDLPWYDLFSEMERITKQNSAIAIFGTEPFSYKLKSTRPDLYKYDFYYKKCKSLGANFCHAKNSPIKIIENIMLFSKAKISHEGKSKNRMTYNPQGLVDCKTIQRVKTNKIDAFRYHIDRKSHKTYTRTKSNFPTNIIEIGFDKDERKNRFHPTQKPIKLLEYLIKTYTNENDVVLDFCMGSGSTGVACVNTNRNFIGIEKDEKYYEIAKKRIL